jgi:hypothetical protein
MAKEAQSKLFEALEARIAKIEAELDLATGPNKVVLYQRLEAALSVSEWLKTSTHLGYPISLTGSLSNRIAPDPSHASDILLSNISM